MRKSVVTLSFLALFQATAVAAANNFSALANNQHLIFDPDLDILHFDSPAITASAVRVAPSGVDLGFTYGGKTGWLDGTAIGQISFAPGNVTFANGSWLAIGDGTANTLADWYGQDGQDYSALALTTVGQQVWGLGGADIVQTGSGADWLVGNTELKLLDHVSRLAATGGDNRSSSATISADGRFVAFDGDSTNLVPGQNADINIKDLLTGAITNEAVSAAGAHGDSGQDSPVLSADGQWVVFKGNSTTLIPGVPPQTIYIANTTTNVIEVVSTTSGGGAFANSASETPDLSIDGRYVVFTSWASNLAANSTDNNYADVYLKDRLTNTTTRLSTSLTGGDGNFDSKFAKISADGRYVVFQSAASNLTAGDTNGYPDIFLWDRDSSSGNRLTNITKDLPVVSNPNNGCFLPDVAYDNGYGGVVVFETPKILVAADISNFTDIYAYNLTSHAIQFVSSTAAGNGVQRASEHAALSGDGRYVVFTGYSDALVPNDTNGSADIFVKDLLTGAIALVSKAANGTAANQASPNGQISLGGDWIVFESSASNLAATDANGISTDVFTVSNPLLTDTLIGGAGNDTYVIARLADTIQEQLSGGVDTVQSAISYTLGPNLDNLTLTGTADTADLSGFGNSLSNVVTGNPGNNVMDGGDGIDTVSYAVASGPVTVSLALITPQVTGAGSDTLSNFENLIGSAYNDTLTGNGGNNRLDGGTGTDTMAGLAGNDTYVVNVSGDVTTEAVGAGTDTVLSAVTRTLGPNLENLTLIGSLAINGTGNTLPNVLIGNAASNALDGGLGNDAMAGGAGNDTYVVNASGDVTTEALGAGADLVLSSVTRTLGPNLENLTLTGSLAINGTGNALANVLNGNAGNNLLDGGLGNDTMVGAAGNDTYVVNAVGDLTTEALGAGADLVLSSVTRTLGPNLENLTLTGAASINGTGNALANVLIGNSAANALSGGAGNDRLDGGLGNDNLSGGLGNDTYVVNASGDLTTEAGSAGADIVLSSVTRALGPNLENLTLTGSAAINGTGNALANVLTGNVGINLLNGGAGNDTMVGGAGNDTYVVDASGDLTTEALGAGVDTVFSSVTHTLGPNLENLTLTGSAAINGTGNALPNVLAGNAAANALVGGAGADIFILNSLLGSDTISDFASGSDHLRINMSGIPIGDGDTLVEGALTRSAPGGFGPGAELVIFTTNLSTLSPASAAAAIGSATSAYATGATVLFVVDNGVSSALYRFTSSSVKATVSASELTLLATLSNRASTVVGDYLFRN